jgi:formylglycine-generating enzyme required for sulfatase activity/serine/threonine protein kinase
MTEETIFATALEKPADARAAYLAEACGNDEALRTRLEKLLAASDRVGNFMANPVAAPAAVDPAATEASPASADRDGDARRGSPDPVVTEADRGAKATDPDEEPLTFLAPPTRPDSLGRIGHYEVLQVLGRGGFGIVFRAFDDMLQRVVALKVMAPQLAATSPARKRFLREARSSAQVRHENVVQVYEIGEQPLPYLAMEFIPGETLQQKLDRVGPLDVPEVLRIGRQIAEGLAAAHATELIHRDIKPGNMLLEGGQQKVKITDFGLARTADDASISQSGIIAGTPMYMAPEQAQGQTLDQRADLFSLGSVLYQMVAGRPPFRASTAVAVLKRVAEDQPRAIREIIPETPQWLCDIIAKLHAKDPDDRYQSAREVADVLADCDAQLKANAKLKDYSRIPRSKPQRSGRRKWVVAALAMLFLSLLASWFGRAAILFFTDRGELEILPEDGLASVIVLQNDEGVIDGNKLRPLVTDWLDMKQSHTLKLPPGQYQLNVGTWPADTHVSQWEVTTSGPLGSNEIKVPVIDSSAIVTVERGRRVTLRAKLRTESPRPSPVANTPLDANEAQETAAKRLGIPVETVNSIGMKLRFIPPGKFTMGSSREEIDLWLGQSHWWVKDRLPSEAPQHEVEITNPYYLGQTEVTVGQFNQFVQATGYKTQAELEGSGALRHFPNLETKMDANTNWRNPGFAQTDDHPVVCVSLKDAADFCNWLSKQEGKEYRLPTEAEWEYSCRAGSKGRWSFGDDEGELLNHARTFSNSKGHTWPVAGLKENAWGLHDMHGNAWEWCQDAYDADYYKTSPPKDPPGPRAGGARVCRGGSWYDPPAACRSAFRSHEDLGFRFDNNGFRVVLVVSPPASVRTESGAKDKATSPAIAPFPDADVQRIAALPAAEQVEEVRKELMRRNPSFDGKMEHKIEDGVVTEFKIVTDQVTDIAPIRVWSALRVLECRGTYTNQPNGLLADLTALKAMNLAALTQINLGCTKVTDAGMVYFKDCKVLRGLYLDGTKVTDAGMVYFKDCKHLTALRLDTTKVTDRGLVHFQDCRDLTYLNLSWTKVSDEGLAHFKDCQNLTSLNLGGTRVSDAGLIHFKDCKALTRLELQYTEVGDASLTTFKGMLLRVLWFDKTGITDLTPLQGMPLQDIRLTPKNFTRGLDILRDVKSLKTIGTSWAQSWPAAEFWERYDKGEFGRAFTDADVKRIAALPAVEQVEEVRKELIKRNPGFDGKVEHKIEDGVVTELRIVTDQVTDIAPIRVWSALRRLDCSGTCTDQPNGLLADLTPLKGMNLASLRHLDLSETRVTDAGMLYLKDCKDLTFLQLGRTKVTDRGLAHFKDCKALTTLDLYGTDVSDVGLANFRDCKKLMYLHLEGTDVGDAGLAHFKDCKDLTYLFLNTTRVSDAGLSQFKDCKALTRLLLAGTDVSNASLSQFKGTPLTVLWIQNCRITDLSTLQGMPLEAILLTPNRIAQGMEVLRGMKGLKTIGIAWDQSWPAAEFWERYDKWEFK